MASVADADVHSPSHCEASQRSFYKAVKRTDDSAVFQSDSGSTETLWRVGQTNTLEGFDGPVLCRRGFHACRNPVVPFLNFLGYGYSHLTDVLLEVTLGGTLVTDGLKTAATSCTPVRVVPDEELAELMRSTTVVTNSKSGDEYYVKDGKLHRDGDEPAVVFAKGGKQEWHKHGVLHRDGDRPARIWADGSQEWFKDGLLHRDDDRPAVINANGSQEWFKDGMRHRDDDRPAWIGTDGSREWYKDGKLHRDGDETAWIGADGSREWYKNGKLHRDEDKPARISADGTQEWYRDGKLHRDGDKPAWIGANGSREWYKNGKLHRDGGKPAVVKANGNLEWYRDGHFVATLDSLDRRKLSTAEDLQAYQEILREAQGHLL